ncbi:hypothetical protein O181_075203 [Austropuccinia psidii MF-1]|uniref:U1 small nuclear ribonucleoprotein C n=1 Tax=Austropuccinia psidii MF-1 TaxID=1389203 RepID=A0A9Q3F8F3_9BASI|nr:hypothetical protein [Austropuccinia psidii MF-1]
MQSQRKRQEQVLECCLMRSASGASLGAGLSLELSSLESHLLPSQTADSIQPSHHFFHSNDLSKEMGKYYCDYCDVFLVSESPSVRKAHNSGRNHLTNVRDYYSSLGHDKAQNYIDEITRMFESGGSNSTRGPGPGAPTSGPPNPPMNGTIRPPFQSNGPSGPNLPPFPPAMLALMNGSNGISSLPGSGPPPMRFAGPPIINNITGGMPPPTGMNGFPVSGHPPASGPLAPGNQVPPPLVSRMNPDRARQLDLL